MPAACARCNAFASETRVPAEALGQTGAPIGVCWLCAHFICHHDATLEYREDAPCGCSLETIYPERDFTKLPGPRREASPAEPIADLSPLETRVQIARAELGKAEKALAEAKGPKSFRVPARERQAQARAAASKTAAARATSRAGDAR